METQIAQYTLHADAAATAALYADLPQVAARGVRELNFIRNLDRISETVQFFKTLGIDPYKTQDLFAADADAQKQTVTYTGMLAVVGSTNAPIEDLEDDSPLCLDYEDIGSGFEILISHTENALNINFVAELPWVLSKPIVATQFVDKVIYPPLAEID